MKRPYVMSFMAIDSIGQISIKTTITDSTRPERDSLNPKATSPIQSIGFMKSSEFRMKVVGISDSNEEIFSKDYESDSYGSFDIKIPNIIGGQSIKAIQIYELSYYEGIQLLLGSFLPFQIKEPKKIIVCDFDKTLVDTKFSSAKEVYNSLKTPLTEFPNIEGSIDLLKQHTDEGFQPFILSASPHFYEGALRDWFYQNKIYVSNILLKDYRTIFSLRDGLLTTKDMKSQGFYKLNQLVNVLLMTGVPSELVLVGDGFESDSFIYLCLYSVLVDRTDPWALWNKIKKDKSFKLTSKQDSQFLSKFYQLSELSKKNPNIDMKIYIRSNKDIFEKAKNQSFKLKFIEKNKSVINHYLA
jgi:phosphoserine phosphatase